MGILTSTDVVVVTVTPDVLDGSRVVGLGSICQIMSRGTKILEAQPVYTHHDQHGGGGGDAGRPPQA